MPSYASWRVLLVGLAAAIAVAAYVHAQRGPRPRLPEPALVKRSPLDRAVAGTPELSLQPPVGRSPLAERMDRVAAGVAGDFTDVRALLVVQNGALPFERYLRGAAADTPFNVKSVTKSVVSSLVGIALRDGSVRSGPPRPCSSAGTGGSAPSPRR